MQKILHENCFLSSEVRVKSDARMVKLARAVMRHLPFGQSRASLYGEQLDA